MARAASMLRLDEEGEAECCQRQCVMTEQGCSDRRQGSSQLRTSMVLTSVNDPSDVYLHSLTRLTCIRGGPNNGFYM